MKTHLSYMVEEPLKLKGKLDFHYIGDVMYFAITDCKIVKVELVSDNLPDDCFNNLRVSIIDKIEGKIDSVLIPFSTVFEEDTNKYLRNEGHNPDKYEWPQIPSETDFDNLTNSLMEYLELWK